MKSVKCEIYYTVGREIKFDLLRQLHITYENFLWDPQHGIVLAPIWVRLLDPVRGQVNPIIDCIKNELRQK